MRPPQRMAPIVAAIVVSTCLVVTPALGAMPSSVRFVHYASSGAQHNGTGVHQFYANNAPNEETALYWVEGRDYAAGLDAAFMEANENGGIHGVPVERYHLEHDGETEDFTAVSTPYAAALATPNVFGTGATTFQIAVQCHYTSQSFGMASIGNVLPIAAAFDVDQSRHAIHIRMPFDVDTRQLAEYAVQSALRCKRSGILYFGESDDVVRLSVLLHAALEELGYATPEPILINFNDVNGFMTNVSTRLRIAESLARPQCLFILMDTSGVSATLSVLTQIPSFNVGDYAILTPSVVYSSDWRSVRGFDQGWYAGLFSLSHFPNPVDTRYLVSRNFIRAISRLHSSGYPRSTVASVRGNAAAAANWRPSYPAMEGYLIGRLFIDACRATSPQNFTVAGVLDSFYRVGRFVIDDFPLGPYSDKCVGRYDKLSYACKCNSGTRRLFMNRVNQSTGTTDQLFDNERYFEVGVAESAIPDSACTIAQMAAAVPLIAPQIHVIIDSGNAPAELRRIVTLAQLNMFRIVELATALGVTNNHDIDIIPVNTPAGFEINTPITQDLIPELIQLTGYAASALSNTEYANVSSIRGYFNFAPLQYRFALKDAPLPPYADWNPYFVPFFPTLTDYANAAVARAVDRSPAGASRVVIIADTAEAVAQLTRTVHHHQQEPRLTLALFPNASQAEMRWTNPELDHVALVTRLTQLMGATTSDDTIIFASQNVDSVGQMLHSRNAYRSRTVVFTTSEFVLYDAMRAMLADDPSATQSASGEWTGDGTWHYASMLQGWTEDAGRLVVLDPALAYTAVIASFVVNIATADATTRNPSPWKAVNQMYETRSFGPSIGRTFIGPFSNASCRNTATLDEHPGDECQCNKGAGAFYIRHLNPWMRALVDANDTAAVAHQGDFELRYTSGCGFRLDPLVVPPPDKTLQNALASAAAGLVFICAIVSITCFFANRGKRDNSCAPKDSSKPFAMVFTDIQSSTTLWARAPSHMGPAVDAHHELIRELIPKHRGYEVKTIGDSFMIAFEHARDAVDFACALQSVFYDHDWGTHVFDETYKELISDAEQRRLAELQESEGANTAPNSALAGQPQASPLFKTPRTPFEDHTPDDGWYDASVWNGLRVRVGVHFGHGDIKLDPVSQGYDYYGTVVNTAARVEGVAHGGQIAVTAAVVEELTQGGSKSLERDLGLAVHDFGPQPLRGLDEPIGLTQVLPARFASRKYPPLRLDVEMHVEESEPSSDGIIDANSASTVGSRRSSAKYTVDDLINHMTRRHKDSTERHRAYRRILFGKITLETMMSTSSVKWRDSTVSHLADKWRISQLRKEPGMGRYRRRLKAVDIDLVLLAYRISTAAERATQEHLSSDSASQLSRESTMRSARGQPAGSSMTRPANYKGLSIANPGAGPVYDKDGNLIVGELMSPTGTTPSGGVNAGSKGATPTTTTGKKRGTPGGPLSPGFDRRASPAGSPTSEKYRVDAPPGQVPEQQGEEENAALA